MKRTLLLFLTFVAMWQSVFAYDFSAVAPSGQTLYYSYGLSGRVSVSYPNRVYSDCWSGYTKPTGSLIIPDSVTYNGAAYAVTSIGEHAFYNCSGLTSVTMPNFVTSIGGYAFFNCSGLTSVMIPNSVNSIGDMAFYYCSGLTTVHFNADSCTSAGSSSSVRAFYGCNNISTFTFGNNVRTIPQYLCYDMDSLSSVTIGNSVVSIGDYAFRSCSGLTSVTIPNSVTYIGQSAFGDCRGLTSVNFDADSCTSAGVFNNGGFVFRGCNNVTTFTIGNNVKIIPSYLCYNMSSLVSLTIGNSVTSIGYSAFESCSGLTSVTIPNSVTTIGNNAFNGCSGLSSVIIPNSATSVGNSAFCGCSGLTSVIIGNSVPYIGDSAFLFCSGLTSVTIPNSVTSIGEEAFGGCSGLTSVFIPNSVTSIGDGAFAGCSGLTSISIPNSVTSIGIQMFFHCTGLTSVTIGNSVTSIGREMFYYCTGLTSVTIGNSVTSIGIDAFRGCVNLISVNLLPETAPTIERSSFNDYVSDRLFHIPCGSWDSYYNASSWSYYRSKLREPVVNGVSIELASNNENFGRTNAITQHNGTRVSCDSTTVIYATARDGYHFDHWSNGNTANPDTLHLVGDSLVTAFFAPNQHTITVISADESLGTASGGGTYHYGDTIYLTAIATAEHYHFSHWSAPSGYWYNNSNPWRFVVGDYDVTWIANFAIDTHSVSVASNDIARGMVEATGTQFEYGQPCTVTATAYSGYTFHSWSNGMTDNPYTFAVLSDVELTANFIAAGEQVYTITVQSADPTMGTVSGGGQALRGGTLTIRAQGNAGYRFLRWQDGNTDSVRTVTVTGNATYTAYFSETVGIEEVSVGDELQVWVSDGCIHVRTHGREAEGFEVYDVMGRLVAAVAAGRDACVPVPAGVYLVRVAGLPARKVVVMR